MLFETLVRIDILISLQNKSVPIKIDNSWEIQINNIKIGRNEYKVKEKKNAFFNTSVKFVYVLQRFTDYLNKEIENICGENKVKSLYSRYKYI